ncbi:unnamed protein product [Amoebophrya sp. A120]|nr:unnamed protein product [Amoebophrya sp. A120]|eukprot:GSA120T00021745001.1
MDSNISSPLRRAVTPPTDEGSLSETPPSSAKNYKLSTVVPSSSEEEEQMGRLARGGSASSRTTKVLHTGHQYESSMKTTRTAQEGDLSGSPLTVSIPSSSPSQAGGANNVRARSGAAARGPLFVDQVMSGEVDGASTTSADAVDYRTNNLNNNMFSSANEDRKILTTHGSKITVLVNREGTHAMAEDDATSSTPKGQEGVPNVFLGIYDNMMACWLQIGALVPKYEPFDRETQKTDLMELKVPFWLKLGDRFGKRLDRGAEVTPEDSPQTIAGCCFSVVLFVIVSILFFGSLGDFFSDKTSLEAMGEIQINVEKICPSLASYDGGRGIGRTDKYAVDFSDCEYNEKYLGDWMTPAEPPQWDLPVTNFHWVQNIEFYEADSQTSLAKIEWRDNTGMHFGGTSAQDEIPVAFGAQEKVPIIFNSYPAGGSDMDSPYPNMTRFIREMAVTSDTHNYDESLRYAYSDLGLLPSVKTFFDHDVAAFVRFDRKQLRNVKSCQFQAGVVAKYQYEALRPSLLKHSREYQKTTSGKAMDTLASSNFSWAVSHYTNTESGTWRRRTSMDNMMIITSNWTTANAKAFMQSTAWGKYRVNVERRLRTVYGINTGYNDSLSLSNNTANMARSQVPIDLVDWMLFASYVNNFQYSADTMICDGKRDAFFNTAYVKANKPTKTDKTLTLKSPVYIWTVPFPFYITVTGDMGVERMLVTAASDSKTLKVTRGTSIGSTRLNFKTDRPTDYPAVSNPELWVCPPNRYMDGEFCDCNCGMTDPDCLAGTLPVLYCASSEICSPLGRCTFPVYNPRVAEVAVSEPCYALTMPGEVSLYGYIGEKSEFEAVGGSECKACPHDTLYSGATNKNEKNEYVCQYRPEGDIPASEVLQQDANTIRTYGTTGNVTVADTINYYRIVKAEIGPKAGFPVKNITEQNYTIELNLGQGIHELATAVASETLDSKTKTQLLHLKATGNQFRNKHFASAKMVSSMTGDYQDMVMQLDDPKQTFSETGPFRLQIDSSEVVIRSGSTVTQETARAATTSSSTSRRALRKLGTSSAGGGLGGREAASVNDAIQQHEQSTVVRRDTRSLEDILASAEENLSSQSAEQSSAELDANKLSPREMKLRRLQLRELNGEKVTEQQKRQLQTTNTTTATTSANSASAMKTAKRQRLDVGGFPKGLSPAGVKGTLARQYVANLSPDTSIYNYLETDTQTAGAGGNDLQMTSPARNLLFQDSNLNSVPGETNCFTSFYVTPFNNPCLIPAAMTSRVYTFLVKLKTAPWSNGMMMSHSQNWDLNNGGRTSSGQNVGLASWGALSDAFRTAFTFGLGLQTSSTDSQHDDIVSVRIGNFPSGIPFPGWPAPDNMNRETEIAVHLSIRRWAEIEFLLKREFLDPGSCNGQWPPTMACSGTPADPYMGPNGFKYRIQKKFREQTDPNFNTAMREVFWAQNYLTVPYDPMFPQIQCPSDCFEILEMNNLFDGDGARRLEEEKSTERAAVEKNKEQTPKPSSPITVAAPQRHLQTSSTTRYNYFSELQVKIKAQNVHQPPGAIASNAQFQLHSKQAFVHACTESSVSGIDVGSIRFEAFADTMEFGAGMVYDPMTGQMISVAAGEDPYAMMHGGFNDEPDPWMMEEDPYGMGPGAGGMYDPMMGGGGMYDPMMMGMGMPYYRQRQLESARQKRKQLARKLHFAATDEVAYRRSLEAEIDEIGKDMRRISAHIRKLGAEVEGSPGGKLKAGEEAEFNAEHAKTKRSSLEKDVKVDKMNPEVVAAKQTALSSSTTTSSESEESSFALPRQLTPDGIHTLRVVFEIERTSVNATLLAEKAALTKWKDDFKAKLKTLSPLINDILNLDYSPTGKPYFEENFDETPLRVQFGTDPAKAEIMKERPWCDYSSTGKPGVSIDGTDYTTTGRSSIFCDGLHDGLLVVNAGGFSDTEKVPKNSNMRILIRASSSDQTKTTPMEVRTIKRAYQWLFPIIDPNTGELGDDQVTSWTCSPEQWSDGVCDCNCGRVDWDCMGDRGIPQQYVETVLDNPEVTVQVNINCPFGNDRVVKVPELAEGELPPTCGQVKSQPAKYAYCQYLTGIPTSIPQNAYQSADGSFNGTMLKAPEHLKYLWEVIEIDSPLQKNREVGTQVETLGVSESTAAAYQSKALEKAKLYVDTAIMEQSHDMMHLLLENAESVDPMCYSENPPPHCTGGKVSFGGQTVQTTPVVKANVTLAMDLPAGTTGAQLLDDPEVVDSFRFALADTYSVAPYEVEIKNFVVGSSRRELEMLKEKNKERKVPFREQKPYHHHKNAAKRRLAATSVQVDFEIAKKDKQEADNFGTQMATVSSANLLKNLQNELRFVGTIAIAATAVTVAVKTETKMPDTNAMAAMVTQMGSATGSGSGYVDPAMLMAMDMMQDAGMTVAGYNDVDMHDPYGGYHDPYDPYGGQHDPYDPYGGQHDPYYDPYQQTTSRPGYYQPTYGTTDPMHTTSPPSTGNTGNWDHASTSPPVHTPNWKTPMPGMSTGSGTTNNHGTWNDDNMYGTTGPPDDGMASGHGSWNDNNNYYETSTNMPGMMGPSYSSGYGATSMWPRTTRRVSENNFKYRKDLESIGQAIRLKASLTDSGLLEKARKKEWTDKEKEDYKKEAELLNEKIAYFENLRKERREAKKETNKRFLEQQKKMEEETSEERRRRLLEPHYMSEEEEMIFLRLKEKFPWMHEVVTRDRLQSTPHSMDASTMAETLKNDVFNDEDWIKLMKIHGHSEHSIRKLQEDIPDYHEISPEALEWRRLDAIRGSDHLSAVKEFEDRKKMEGDNEDSSAPFDGTSSAAGAIKEKHPNDVLREQYSHMILPEGGSIMNLYGQNGELTEELYSAGANTVQNDPLDFATALPGSEEYERRFLIFSEQEENSQWYVDELTGERRRQLTSSTNSSNSSNATTRTTTITCPAGTLDWSDNTKWPPNAKIDQVPQCALPSLSQQQLTDLGFYDKVHTTKVVSGADTVAEAVSAFAASVAQKMPAKKVISYVVQTITAVNLFRDKSSVYLPKDRYKETVTETFTSPNVLEVEVGLFVMPKRVQIQQANGALPLCPNRIVANEKLVNIYSQDRSVEGGGWASWTFEHSDNFRTMNCQNTPFTFVNGTSGGGGGAGGGGGRRKLQAGGKNNMALSAKNMKDISEGKYRMFYLEEFLPTNTFQYEIKGPLTGHWRLPEERGDAGFASTKPEWGLDLETIFSLTFDKKFLDVEKAYMSGSTDYVDGQMRLWAAEPLVRGKAKCMNTVNGCAQGIPANAPMFLPSIHMTVDREKTKDVLENTEPEYWPPSDHDEKLEKLFTNLESQTIDLSAALRGLTSSEDGRIAILPQRAIQIRLVWSVSPIYLEHKYDGSIILDRWVSNIGALDISYGQADHTMKSKCSVRLVFEIDHASIRFKEIPNMSLAGLLALIGALAGYTAIFAAILGLWQKFVRPFGLINIFDMDDAILAKHEEWSARAAEALANSSPLSAKMPWGKKVAAEEDAEEEKKEEEPEEVEVPPGGIKSPKGGVAIVAQPLPDPVLITAMPNVQRISVTSVSTGAASPSGRGAVVPQPGAGSTSAVVEVEAAADDVVPGDGGVLDEGEHEHEEEEAEEEEEQQIEAGEGESEQEKGSLDTESV